MSSWRWRYHLRAVVSLQIFLDDTPEADSLPRDKVSEFLISIKRGLGIRYLEHLIEDLQEMSPAFHDRLVTLFLEAASDPSIEVSQQEETRDKLVRFLEESDQYMPERVFARLRDSTSM